MSYRDVDGEQFFTAADFDAARRILWPQGVDTARWVDRPKVDKKGNKSSNLNLPKLNEASKG